MTECMHAEAGEGYQVSCSTTLCHIPLREDLLAEPGTMLVSKSQ